MKLWEGRGTTDDIVVDYISTGYLEGHLGSRTDIYDMAIVRGMVTQRLVMGIRDSPLLKLHPTFSFRKLQSLDITNDHDLEIHLLSYLEQVR